MSRDTKDAISRRPLAARWLYGASAFLLAAVLVYGGVIALVSTQVESSQDRVGIQTSILVAISSAAVGLVLAVVAFLISRSVVRRQPPGTVQRSDGPGLRPRISDEDALPRPKGQ
jgi:cation transporter-like permease